MTKDIDNSTHKAGSKELTSATSRQYYIGLMTGTSMDGIDAVLVDFSSDDQHKLELIATHSHAIPADLRTKLLELSLPGEDTIDLLGDADVQLGALLADAVDSLLANTTVKPEHVTAIGSHGQTIRHRPPNKNDGKGGSSSFTLQIGDPNKIAARANITTVADFRRRDMALGGHGAPLVPAFHKAFFQHPKRHRVIVNIGGIANITCLPAENIVTGFDTGPGNTLLDAWSNRHLGQAYDNHGQWAARHRHHPKLLEQLKTNTFFSLTPPKSTGRETFNLSWLDSELKSFDPINSGTVQATLLSFSAETIAEAILNTQHPVEEVYICGGGALNTALMAKLGSLLAPARVSTTDELGMDPQWVEAIAFAWLARQTLLGLPGNLPEVTGATKLEVLGAIYPVTQKKE